MTEKNLNRLKKDKLLKSFTMIPNLILYDPNLSPAAKSLYAILASFSEGWIIRKSHLVTLSSSGMFSLKSAWSELVKRGYMVVKQHRNEQGLYCGSDTTLFAEPTFFDEKLLEPAVTNDSEPMVENRPTVDVENTIRDREYRSAGERSVADKQLIRLTNNNTKITNIKKYKKDLESDFERFWDVYPRRVAKGAAKRAFEKATKGKDVDSIIEGAKRYSAYVMNNGTEEKYQAHPSKWLNSEQWDDEISTTKILIGNANGDYKTINSEGFIESTGGNNEMLTSLLSNG